MGANGQRRRWVGVAGTLLAGLLTLAGACSEWAIEDPELPAVLGPEVDSVVVQPMEAAPGVEMNAADLALLGRHLRRAVDDTERLRSFGEPPTLLANTVLLAGRLERYAVNERRGEGLYLRTIELAAEVRVLDTAGEETGRLQREVAWQKAYPPGPVSALELDLEDALRELARQVVRALAPPPLEEPVALRDGMGPDGRSWSDWMDLNGFGMHPGLRKGNRLAAAGLFERAGLAWRAVLFDPAPMEGPAEYRVTTVTLNRLRAAGLSEEVVEGLQPLTAEDPLPLVEFRSRLREVLGGPAEQEGLILTLSDVRGARTHRVLAAAHANLGAVAALQGRNDLVAFHWSRAWAHQPEPELLERWQALQAERKVLPRDLDGTAAMALYLSLPPPSTARVQPGRFERSVLPPPAFPEDGEGAAAMAAGAAPPAAMPGTGGAPEDTTGGAAAADTDTAAGTPDEAAQNEAAPGAGELQPVALPPPADPATDAAAEASGAAAGESTTESTPGRAAGSGPSDPQGAAAEPPPPRSAPAAQ